MIILQKLKWDNCFSYGKNNELDLADSTLTQIIGTNGMGKSSIPLIIEEVLFNKNSKGIKKVDIPNRYLNDGYSISLSFSKDDDLYEVAVERKNSIKVKLEKNNEDISSHTATNTYKSIQEILGLDFKTFSQLVYQSTNTSLQFLTATDANRKKFLIDLLQLENYIKLFEVFKEGHKKVSLGKTSIQSKVATIEKWLETNKLVSASILPMKTLEINTKNIEDNLRTLLIEFENISENNKKISKNNEYKKLLEQIPIQQLQSARTEYVDFSDLLGRVGELDSDAKKEKTVIAKLEKLGQECPTCNQVVSRSIKQSMISEAATKISLAEGEKNELTERIKSIKFANAEHNKVQNDIKTWEDLYRSINSDLPTDLVDKHELESKLTLVRSDLQDRKNEVSKIIEENQKRTKYNTRIQVILEQTETFTKELNECTVELSKIIELESYLEILKKSFSTTGLLSYKIESLVKDLESLVNQYLAELSDGRFTLEFVVSNDKLNVQITDNGNIVDILALSSGELARVNTATLIAIRKLMSSISKSKINILFLDEVINVLDDIGREKIVEILLQEEELNTYIVSHGWTHPLLSKIEVLKKGNVSILE